MSGSSPPAARGVRTLTAGEFSVADAVGGVRGLAESVAPGLVFVVVYVATSRLSWSLIASVGVALVAVVARLVQRTPVVQAVGGLLGIGIGVIWAWRSGQARDYYVWGLVTNVIFLVGILASIAVRWPLVGVVVEGLRGGLSVLAGLDRDEEEEPAGGAARKDGAAAVDGVAAGAADGAGPQVPDGERFDGAGPVAQDAGTSNGVAANGAGERAPGSFAEWAAAWRSDRFRMRRYLWASWLWVGLFAARLAVQVPLYRSGSVGWLGTARLVMGLPLWALVLWLTWVLVRTPHETSTTDPDAANVPSPGDTPVDSDPDLPTPR